MQKIFKRNELYANGEWNFEKKNATGMKWYLHDCLTKSFKYKIIANEWWFMRNFYELYAYWFTYLLSNKKTEKNFKNFSIFHFSSISLFFQIS